MITNRIKSTLPFAVVTAIIVMLAGAPGAHAAEAPIKEVLAAHIGSKVNATTGENLCTIPSGNLCQPGTSSNESGGFEFPRGIAVGLNGDIYVADVANRVQELKPNGEFVLAFGDEVNSTTHANICTEEEIKNSAVKCGAGVAGPGAGQFSIPTAVAVDPTTGNIYLQDDFNWRIDEYTPAGIFILTFGKGVNEATGGNICTAEEVKSGVKCRAGVRNVSESREPSAFNFEDGSSVLAAGGPEDLLYVGDQHRVQEFKADGTWVREVPLTAISSLPEARVTALTVDSLGDLYLVYREGEGFSAHTNTIRVFSPSGSELKHFALAPTTPEELGGERVIIVIALESDTRLAVVEREAGKSEGETFTTNRGRLYDVGPVQLHLVTEFATPGALFIAFSAAHTLYASQDLPGSEVVAYEPKLVAELITSPQSCTPTTTPQPGIDESDAAFRCVLNGEVNPHGISSTEAGFQWGPTVALGNDTARQALPTGEEPVSVSATIDGLRPNEVFFDRLVATDANVEAPEQLGTELASFRTPIVAPVVLGGPTAPFVRSSSAVMFARLNPENASTHYDFQYGACENLDACPTRAQTGVLESSVYGNTGATIETRDLVPSTEYHYRLVASNETVSEGQPVGGTAVGAEGVLITAPAAGPVALTEGASAIGPTSAVITGSVDPNGRILPYSFELGMNDGALTQYVTVTSGSTGSGSSLEQHSLALSGLQPGAGYAYRISIAGVHGAPLTFTTQGLPSVLAVPSPLAMLAVPNIAFPTLAAAPPPLRPQSNAQKLAKALKACKKKRSKKQRTACQRQAHRKYVVNTNAKGKKHAGGKRHG